MTKINWEFFALGQSKYISVGRIGRANLEGRDAGEFFFKQSVGRPIWRLEITVKIGLREIYY
jgi:hypothetical protein